MKKINKEQIDSIVGAFDQVKGPVQLYNGIVKMLENLPEACEEKVEETEEVVK